ncbi:hypothetical protein EST38_g8141 [Candolleomyces aberdarensis]|uniref:Mediator of RNA polymerase II transcription subunit 25 n=1 Tax=Candolleomyces aberdarensis TaxID=2316362 RepID=A0A4Q2DDD8_9AGAR|nr:hypothetical protein EST38_g8141 [Candolleomyces aberdarensis]
MDTIPVQIRTLFAPTVPCQASSVLFLIENSDRMASIWSDMRDYCLKPLLSEFDEANRNAPIKVFAVESLPNSPAGLPHADRESPNGLHHGLGNIRFNGSPMNRISAANVDAAIDLLSSVVYAGQPVSSHLIIVAASAPFDNPLLGIRQYAWFLLAEKLKKARSLLSFYFAHPGNSPYLLLSDQANIYCHLVLARNEENMSSLIGLFDKTRWLEGTMEVNPLVQTVNESRFIFKFAAHPEIAMTYTTPPNINNVLEGRNLYQGFPLHLPVAAGVSTAELGSYSTPSGSSLPINHPPKAGTSQIQGHPGYHDPAYGLGGPLKSNSEDPFFPASSTSSEGASPASWAYPSGHGGIDRSDFDVFQ